MRRILTRFVLLACWSLTIHHAMAQTTVTGSVTDADTGETLAGATINVVGIVGSVTTDNAGSYNIQVSSLTDKLQVSYVGYQTQVVDINGKTVLNIRLALEDEALEE